MINKNVQILNQQSEALFFVVVVGSLLTGMNALSSFAGIFGSGVIRVSLILILNTPLCRSFCTSFLNGLLL